MTTDFLELRKKYPSLSLADLQAVIKCPHILDKEQALNQVAQGYPLSYLLGEAPFGPVMLSIGPPLLIPRQETWEWLSVALQTLSPGPRALDLGCGPGTLSVGLSLFFPKYFQLLAIDICPEALAYTKKNLQSFSFSSFNVLLSDWFSNIPQNQLFDIIVSNPPYCSELEISWMQNTQYESPLALFGKNGGLSCYNTILQSAKNYLAKGGVLLIEHGAGQGGSIAQLIAFYGYTYWKPIYDKSGAWRATQIRYD